MAPQRHELENRHTIKHGFNDLDEHTDAELIGTLFADIENGASAMIGGAEHRPIFQTRSGRAQREREH